MKLKFAFFILLVSLTSSGIAADAAFNDRQLLQIEKLLEAERAAIKREVILELCQDNPTICGEINPRVATTQSPIDSVSTRSGTPGISEPALSTTSPVSAMQAMMGPLHNSVADRSMAIDDTRFDLEASSANSRASIELGRTISTHMGNNTGEFTNLSFAFSAPLNKDESNTNIATLDGLINAFQASVKYSKFSVHGLKMNHLTEGGDYTNEYIGLCKAAGIDVLKDETCDSNGVKEGLKKNNKTALYGNFVAMFFDPTAWRSTYGFDATLGYEEFKFREVTTLDKAESNETPWSIGLFGGFIPPSNSAFISFGLKFQQAYKASDKRTVCPFESEFDYLECITGSIGTPNEKKKHLAYVDARAELRNMGLSVRVTHDFKNNETGVDVPIYLLKNSKGNLNGGLRLGWTSEDDFGFGVFVGSDFSLLD